MTAFLPIRGGSSVAFSLVVLVFSALDSSFAVTPQSIQGAKEPKSIEAHFDAAQTYQLAGDLERAEAEYRQGISAALQRLGNLKVANGDYAAGLEMLQNAASTDAKNVDARIDLSVAYFHNGEYEKAKAPVLGILQADPANFRGRNLLGKIYFMQGDFQEAVGELQAALAVNPDFDVAYSLALADLELKRLPQATVLFDEMRASLGNTPELHVLLGQAYRQAGFLDLAVAEFKNALERDPGHAHVHAYLGMTYVVMSGEQN